MPRQRSRTTGSASTRPGSARSQTRAAHWRCEHGDSPHARDLFLRVSKPEAKDFAELQRKHATIHLSVVPLGRGTAVVATIDAGSGGEAHVQLNGVGFCPLPDH